MSFKTSPKRSSFLYMFIVFHSSVYIVYTRLYGNRCALNSCGFNHNATVEHQGFQLNLGVIGFISAGNDVSTLESELTSAQCLLQEKPIPSQSGLPIGAGFINWGANQAVSISLLGRFQPTAAWFFAPRSVEDLVSWTKQTRKATPRTKVWMQVGSVKDAVEIARACKSDVLVVQGTDTGGHSLAQGAGRRDHESAA